MTLEERARHMHESLRAGELVDLLAHLCVVRNEERARCARVARGAAASGPAVAVVAEHIARRIESGEGEGKQE